LLAEFLIHDLIKVFAVMGTIVADALEEAHGHNDFGDDHLLRSA